MDMTPNPRITTTFVRNLRKEWLRGSMYGMHSDHAALVLLFSLKMLQDGMYDDALAYARNHGIDLVRIKRARLGWN